MTLGKSVPVSGPLSTMSSHRQLAPVVVEDEEAASAKRGCPGLRVLPSLDLAPLHALFVSVTTKQCHAHALPHNPLAVLSSERSPTRSPLGRAGPNLGAQSLHFSQVWGPKSGSPTPACQEHQPGQPLLSPEKVAAAAALGKTQTARDLPAHLALSLGFSCLHGRPLVAGAVPMILSGSQSLNSVKCDNWGQMPGSERPT